MDEMNGLCQPQPTDEHSQIVEMSAVTNGVRQHGGVFSKVTLPSLTAIAGTFIMDLQRAGVDVAAPGVGDMPGAW